MAFRLGSNASNSARKKATDAIVGAINSGSGTSTGSVKIYSGSQPATPETTASGVLLVTVNFASTAFGSSDTTGAASLSGGAISGTVATGGTAGWFRVVDRDGNAIFDGSITANGGGGDMTFDVIAFQAGGTTTISTMTLATPM